MDGALEVLEALARHYRLVAVISGRSLDDLHARFAPPGVVLAGTYGRERSDRPGPRPAPQSWDAVGVAAAGATADLQGVVVERKGAGVALHYRLAPDVGAEVDRIASALAAEFGLDVRRGRLVAELVAPGPGKDDALAALAAEQHLGRLLYAGDDVADLDAFRRARTLDARCVLVAVASEEAPSALTDEADVVVAGPAELVGLLRELTPTPPPG